MVFFFPGQGSQNVGMGQNLLKKYPNLSCIYEEANDILGFDIQKLSFEGPQEELTKTQNAQVAILTYQYMLQTLLKEKNIIPSATAGHSLGEFSALIASGMLSFADTLKLVQKRGQLMAQADPDGKGGMAVVLGLDDEKVIEICKKISEQYYVEPVNYNAPGQVVISGLKEGVELAGNELKASGAKRVLPLAVSGAFHSQLMTSASEEFSQFIKNFEFKAPICPIISNVNAEAYDEKTVKTLLPMQMKNPVMWVKSVQYIVKQGFNKGIEVNSGSVIQGMVKKICPEFEFEPISTYTEID